MIIFNYYEYKYINKVINIFNINVLKTKYIIVANIKNRFV